MRCLMLRRTCLLELVACSLASTEHKYVSSYTVVVQGRWNQGGMGAHAPAAASEAVLQRDAERLTAALHAVARGTQAHCTRV